MSNSTLLLTIILILQGLLAFVWLGIAAQGLARAPTLHWGVATALIALCLALVVLRRPDTNPWLAHFATNLSGVIGFMALRRGVQLFCGRKPGDHAQAGLLLLTAAALAMIVAQQWPLPWVVAVSTLALGWILLRGGFEAVTALRGEFGPLAAWLCLTPMLLLGGVFAVRGMLAPFGVAHAGRLLAAPGTLNAQYGLVLMTLSLLLNLGLGALMLRRTLNQLRRLSDHDALTGLLNRRGFEQALRCERTRLQRGQGCYALVSLDLDHFKRINDLLGHDAGDVVLEAVAHRLSQTVRPADSVGRTGGEEFCVLLPDVDASRAEQIAQRLLCAVRATPVQIGASKVAITVSAGVAGAADAFEPPLALSRRLDQALYRAKAAGRDCVIVADATAALPVAARDVSSAAA